MSQYGLFPDSEVPVQDIDDTVLTRGSNPSNPVTKVEGECLKHGQNIVHNILY